MTIKWTALRMRGFTLIELLVVVAIVTVLLAILIAGLRLAQEMGRDTICKANLNQLFLGTFLYSEDSDHMLPYFGRMRGRPPNHEWWVTQVAMAMGYFEPRVYRCPSDPTPHNWVSVKVRKGRVYMADRLNLPDRVILDITYRSACDLLRWYSKDQLLPRKITDWEHPDDNILLIEAIPQWSTETSECFRFHDHMIALDPNHLGHTVHPRLDTWTRHIGFSNFLFLDGHVDRMTPDEAGALALQAEFILGHDRFSF